MADNNSLLALGLLGVLGFVLIQNSGQQAQPMVKAQGWAMGPNQASPSCLPCAAKAAHTR